MQAVWATTWASDGRDGDGAVGVLLVIEYQNEVCAQDAPRSPCYPNNLIAGKIFSSASPGRTSGSFRRGGAGTVTSALRARRKARIPVDGIARELVRLAYGRNSVSWKSTLTTPPCICADIPATALSKYLLDEQRIRCRTAKVVYSRSPPHGASQLGGPFVVKPWTPIRQRASHQNLSSPTRSGRRFMSASNIQGGHRRAVREGRRLRVLGVGGRSARARSRPACVFRRRAHTVREHADYINLDPDTREKHEKRAHEDPHRRRDGLVLKMSGRTPETSSRQERPSICAPRHISTGGTAVDCRTISTRTTRLCRAARRPPWASTSPDRHCVRRTSRNRSWSGRRRRRGST